MGSCMKSAIADHWGKRDIYNLIVSVLKDMSKPLDSLRLEDLAPVDHFHARGLSATVDLADRLPIRAGQWLLDIGCGVPQTTMKLLSGLVHIQRRVRAGANRIDLTYYHYELILLNAKCFQKG